jgi:hypothetical protein
LQILVQAVENDSLDHEGRGSLSGSILKNVLPFQIKCVFINSYIDVLNNFGNLGHENSYFCKIKQITFKIISPLCCSYNTIYGRSELNLTLP